MKFFKLTLCLILLSVMVLGIVACSEPAAQGPTDTGSSDVQHEQSDATDEVLPPPPPQYDNPLTGISETVNNQGNRPVAVMINNMKQALPQEGVSRADILVECLVEGGITRLMGVFSDYQSAGVIGSVRSARPYFLDFAQMFDAIYCHHGGSDEAYAQIASRKLDTMDGIRKDPKKVYYRDPERLKKFALEHTMMVTGEGIAQNIAHLNYRTTLREGYALPFIFAPKETAVSVGTQEATHVYLPMSGYQKVDYVYDAECGEYLRYQHNGNKHIDGKNDTQLSFKNILVLFCNTTVIDGVGHLAVTTTGSGSGYLISEGKSTEITWLRSDKEGNLTLIDAVSGAPITLNRGKTAINVCTVSIKSSVRLNATDRIMQE